MVDGKRLLDALVGAVSKAGPAPGQASQGGLGNLFNQLLAGLGPGARDAAQNAGSTAGQVLGQATGGLRDIAQRANEATGNVGTRVDEAVGQARGEAANRIGDAPAVDQYVRTAKDFMNRNPGLAEAALMGVAGLLLSNRRSRGVATNLAGLGGLALVSGLAYKAFQNFQSGKPLLDAAAQGAASPALPGPAAFDPAAATDDDAVRFVRAMVAAATADGHMDEGERSRILQGLSQAGIDPDTSRWLERELADPADVEELAEGINTPEKGAQVYAAARLAIEPDTIQEREFLRQLATALDLDPALVRQIDDTATGIKVTG